MRRDRALLDDMIEAAASIGAIVAETNYQAILADEVRKAAILHHFAVKGSLLKVNRGRGLGVSEDATISTYSPRKLED